jgi:hypothetical protein
MMLTIIGRKQIINCTGKMFANTSRKYLKIIYSHPRIIKFTAKNMGLSVKRIHHDVSQTALYMRD